jgi:hypothetical protein
VMSPRVQDKTLEGTESSGGDRPQTSSNRALAAVGGEVIGRPTPSPS